MPSFSKSSKEKLDTCHPDLQRLFIKVVENYDCTIICGTRGKEEQEDAFMKGFSKLHYPQSKHNSLPSKAVDVMPYPIDWNDRERLLHFAGYVKANADMMGIKVRWGGDWTMDLNFHNDSFVDMPHWEIVD